MTQAIKDMRQLLILALQLVAFFSNGQTRTITGKVLYDDFSPIYQAKIWDHKNIELGTTDINGEFKIDFPTNTAQLEIGMIGMEVSRIEVPTTCERIEIIMIPNGTYHYRSHKKIDRLRKRLYDRTIALHPIAFKKKLFTSATPCYQREFEQIKPRLDEIRKEHEVKRKENEKAFRELSVGDTVRIPYSTTFRADGTDRTSLHVYSYVVDGETIKCIIEGVVIDKSKDYQFTYRVTNCDLCSFQSTVYDNKDMREGQVFKHNMRYFKVLTK